jgi:hypothetical protein
MREPGAAGSSDDRHDKAVAQLGVSLDQARGRAEQDVRCLQRLDAADEQQHHSVSGQSQSPPRCQGVTGREDVEVDTRRDGHDARGFRVVQADQLVSLRGSRRDQAVGGVDDLRLTDDP